MGDGMRQYLELVRRVVESGELRDDRTGVGTLSIFGVQTRYDLRDGFPILTTKKVVFASVVRELLWFLRGSTNVYDGLSPHTSIWDPWADADGELGPIYGYQWRNWNGQGIDQIRSVIEQIQEEPMSRRLVVSAWNVGDLKRMALPPCHAMFQFYVCGGRLDCHLYQRSGDLALGVPFNIASYALLLMIVAQQCELIPGVLVHSIGDAHVYINHLDRVCEQLRRDPLPLPAVRVVRKDLDDLAYDDIELIGYKHHPFIRFKIAV